MRRDADSSKLFSDLIDQLRTLPDSQIPTSMNRESLLLSARAFLDHAAALFRIEEEGLFRFFDAEELSDRVRCAGFEDVEIFESFGTPPQAVIVRCKRP